MSVALILKFISPFCSSEVARYLAMTCLQIKKPTGASRVRSGVRAFCYSLACQQSSMRHQGPSVGDQCLSVPAYLGVGTVGP